MISVERARALRRQIEKAAESLGDEDALEAVELFPIYIVDTVYAVGDRIRFDGVLYKVLQAHTSQVNWRPDESPSLYARVLIPDPDVIPVWEQPDSTNAYMRGDRVHYPTAEGPVYESLVDNNVWSPEAYPAGWEEIMI